MTDHRPGKNNAAKAAARDVQRNTGVSYRQARELTHSAGAAAVETTLGSFLGGHIGGTADNVWRIVGELPAGATLTIAGADGLAIGPDAARRELVTALIGAAAHRQVAIRLRVTSPELASVVVAQYPELTSAAGVDLTIG